MNTFHLSLDVPDLDGAVAFYTELFGHQPAKRKPGYAKFELSDPPVALALQQAGRPALSHLGIRVDSTGEVEAAGSRLKGSGLVTLEERDTACCYARQDKVWVGGSGREPLGGLHRARRHRRRGRPPARRERLLHADCG